MTTMQTSELAAVIKELFVEAFEGAGPTGSWFVSARPDAGIFGTVANLSAAEASRSVREGGPTIAAHVEHLRWWLANVNGVVRGEPWQSDWSGSWTVSRVDEDAWRELRSALRREHDELVATLEGEPDVADPVRLRGLMALAPHAAYHLGAIRSTVVPDEGDA